MVSRRDSREGGVLRRFIWQRLWTISPGKCITSLCWCPDGKVTVLGLEDGTVLLHDVENASGNSLAFEDRTIRYFPPAPRVPRMLGLVPRGASVIADLARIAFDGELDEYRGMKRLEV
ncbi:anaphase-promoting complex subunit 4-like isoform X4 [Syzygium oleosum]|uniref:anaphase-promoting complex subunit 4-like isoform X4 n=1 Tax=Syzygium oleosum TaxID=219896 RepID=UPI0024B89DB5|nr:anaphase-promoting complex subunit 4-like isoform X4 [Syzygium oleosum]